MRRACTFSNVRIPRNILERPHSIAAPRSLFSPDLALTREQSAAMLTRTLGVLGIRTSPTAAVAWTDAASISDFAAEAVNAMYAYGIMGGVSDTAPVFAPKAPYTHEQSILTFNRLYDAVNR